MNANIQNNSQEKYFFQKKVLKEAKVLYNRCKQEKLVQKSQWRFWWFVCIYEAKQKLQFTPQKPSKSIYNIENKLEKMIQRLMHQCVPAYYFEKPAQKNEGITTPSPYVIPRSYALMVI